VTDTLLEIEHLRVLYETRGAKAPAVDDVSLRIETGSSLALAGESGCGKTTLAMACMGLLPPNASTEGSIRFRGNEMIGAKPGRLRAMRWAGISMVFQGAMNALNPVQRVGRQIAEAMVLHGTATPTEAVARAQGLLDEVGIPRSRSRDYPHEFSGGMRQRVMIAMALACKPPLVIADEPTTALDVMVQSQILALLNRLRGEFGLAVVLITHDLSVIAQVCDDVAIMYAGQIVERGSSGATLSAPSHPYTQALVAAFPRVGDPAARGELTGLGGDPPDPLHFPSGCRFHPRCPYRYQPCDILVPELLEFAEDREAACHLVHETYGLTTPSAS
jgi:peptide/nickel transport system ATP-binding protein